MAIVVAGAGWVAGKPIVERWTNPSPSAVADYPGPGHGAASVTIDPGDPGNVIADKLVAAGVIATAGPFIAAFADAGDQASAIQPGTYQLRLEMSARDALTALMDPSSRQLIQFTVPEGKRAEEVYQIAGLAMAQAQAAMPDVAADFDVEAAALAATDELRQAGEQGDLIGLPPEAENHAEGWLFPATYQFNVTTSAAEILAAMVNETIKLLDSLDVDPPKRLEVLTVASLLERESKLEPDRPKTARVIYNRIERGMKLELDSTVVYGVGRFDGNLATSDAERANQNPFNTYVNAGLPAGPIANPGLATIEAALAPADGAWIYFCVVDPSTGEMEFNETWEGHQESVKKWQAWEAEHAG
jgi:UPF0755 protein